MPFLHKIWYEGHLAQYFLLPFSYCFRAIVVLRRWLYKKNFLKTKHFNVPVIVVGNITVGGTGKTPFVIWLVDTLKSQGFKPGIVSRGYGGKASSYPVAVEVDSDAAVVGDEALLLARRLQCPVIVDPRRVNAVQTLLDKYDCDIVVSDDGLQHTALGRSVEIAIIDGDRRFGNGFCLPAGPLREHPNRLKDVDLVISNGDAKEGEHAMRLVSDDMRNVADPSITQSITYLQGKPLIAVAGIGNPDRFFNTLRSHGLEFIENVFPDHHQFNKNDFELLGDKFIIMTEKDAVKCMGLVNENAWTLPVTAEVDCKVGEQIKTLIGL